LPATKGVYWHAVWIKLTVAFTAISDTSLHLEPGTLGPYTLSTTGISWFFTKTVWTWDSWTLHCLHGLDTPGCTRVSQDILDLGHWYFTVPP